VLRRSKQSRKRRNSPRGATRAVGSRAPSHALGRALSRSIWVAIALVAFGAGVAVGRTIVRLDRLVAARFEGRLFQVPSRVYAAPTILYPGMDIDRIGLAGILGRLGYRRDTSPNLTAPGGFHWSHRQLDIYLRPFEHPTRPEPARRIRLRLAGRVVESITDPVARREISAVLLEPESIGAYYGMQREQREIVRLEELPDAMIDAVLAVEDQRFERHRGIDWRRVMGAMWANLQAGGIRQGGSTLTQQLVKNFFLTPERTYRRKMQEALMALLVEARYDKEAILEAYLNEIYLGQRGATAVHGVGEASRVLYGKSIQQIGLHEAALLAALIQSPNGVAPHRNPDAAMARRNLVLQLMRRQGRISDEEYERAAAAPIVLAPLTEEPRETRYFLDALRRQLPQHYDSDVLTSEGLRIYSTLDLRLQQHATAALREGLSALEERFASLGPEVSGRLQGCLVALRPQTGEILALVGGRDYAESQFDRCSQARRPAGSVFKPFVYIAALSADSGPFATLATTLDDSPLTVETSVGPWSPANYDREFHGTVGIREALERSLNVATARLAQGVGIERVAAMARRLGIESELPLVPSLALGAADLSPLELARAYATIANGGVRPEIRLFEDVVDRTGARERRAIAFERVIDPATAYLGISLLQGVVEHGTARGLRRTLAGPIAGKTGTSDDSKDAWFAGITPELVAVVWVGFDEPQSMHFTSSQIALPIWSHFVRDATGGRIRGAFIPPPGVERIEIDPLTGARALASCPRRRIEYFLAGSAPQMTCPARAWPDSEEPAPGVIERLFDRWLWGQG